MLDYLDGPKLFSLRSDRGDLLLAYQCAEDQAIERFVVVPADDRLIERLEQNDLSLRDALVGQPWTWLVDQHRDGTVDTPVFVNPCDLPDDALPRMGAFLHPLPEPLLRICMIGNELQPGRIPSSVIKRAVDGATAAVKTLVHHVLGVEHLTGRPAERIRRYYDLPALELRFGSLLLSFGYPEQAAQIELEEERTLEEIRGLLSKGLTWASDEGTAVPTDSPEWAAIIDAVSKLTPPQKGGVETVEVSGFLSGGNRRPIVLSRHATQRVASARRALSADRRQRSYEGFVRELDKDKFSFWLRSANGTNVCHVEFSADQFDDVLLAFETDREVTVFGLKGPSDEAVELTSIGFTAERAR